MILTGQVTRDLELCESTVFFLCCTTVPRPTQITLYMSMPSNCKLPVSPSTFTAGCVLRHWQLSHELMPSTRSRICPQRPSKQDARPSRCGRLCSHPYSR